MKEDIRNNRQRLLGQCEEKSPLIAECGMPVSVLVGNTQLGFRGCAES